MKKANKTLIEEMVKLFDELWAKDPLNGTNVLNKWPTICINNNWTSEEFDKELDKWQKENFKKRV
jgi:hypothetical protein